MARPSLVLLRWAIRWREGSPDYFKWIAVAIWPVAFFVPPYLIKTGHHPPVGTYIAILGVLAAAVTFRKEPSLLEKGAGIIVFTLVGVAEIRNLYIADEEQANKFNSIRSDLEVTNQGLKQTVTALGVTATTLKGISGQVAAAETNSQKQFSTTQNLEHKEFAGVLTKQQELFDHEEQLAESLNGSLLPSNEPVPKTACGSIPPAGAMLLFGDESKHNGTIITTFPHVVLAAERGGAITPIISLDRDPSGILTVLMDIRSNDGRIIARMNKAGFVVNRNNYLEMKKDRSSLEVIDEYGNEVLKVHYLNLQTISVSGANIGLPSYASNVCSRNSVNDFVLRSTPIKCAARESSI